MSGDTLSGRPRFARGLQLDLQAKLQCRRPPHVLQRRRNPDLAAQRYLAKGLGSAGNKLPLFDANGQRTKSELVKKCVEKGWAEPWFSGQAGPDLPVHRLTAEGLAMLTGRKGGT